MDVILNAELGDRVVIEYKSADPEANGVNVIVYDGLCDIYMVLFSPNADRMGRKYNMLWCGSWDSCAKYLMGMAGDMDADFIKERNAAK